MKIVLSVLLVLLSFISGFPLKDTWYALFQLEFIELPNQLFSGNFNLIRFLAWLGIMASHSGLLVLPFVAGKSPFRKIVRLGPRLFFAFLRRSATRVFFYSDSFYCYLAYFTIWHVCKKKEDFRRIVVSVISTVEALKVAPIMYNFNTESS